MAKKQATISDIAKALNITTSTVSRALNNHPKISIATKELVWEKAKALHYQRNTLASSLRKGKANTIGMIVPRINRHFFSNIITGVESVLNPAGFNLLICQSEEKLQKETSNINTFITNRVGGILISISFETYDVSHIEKAIESGIPVVMFDRIFDQLDVSKVENDDGAGTYELTQHVLEQGYKRLLWLTGPLSSKIYRQRYDGFKNALLENNMNPDNMPLLEGFSSLDVAQKLITDYLNHNEPPEAILSASDYMAMGAIIAIQEKGLRIPEDIAVSGYSNEPFAELISPKLTTVDQFSEEMGKAAAQILLDEIKSDDDEVIHRTTVLKPKLIIRETTIRKK